MLHRFRGTRKSVYSMIILFFMSVLHSQVCHGDIVATDVLIQEARGIELQQQLSAALDRSDVVDLLAEHGVDSEYAKARVASMTDAEATQLAAHFDEMPAGGDVVLLLVIIILILLLR